MVSYAPVNGAGAVCPECGVPWPGRPDEVVSCDDPARRLASLLRMTRDLLDVDVAMLTRIADGHEVVRAVEGHWPGVGSLEGAAVPLQGTLCQRMLEGRVGNVITDVAVDDRVADLVMARGLGVGAWMGVPIEIADAELYVLCCLAREARPGLGAREVRLLTGLAASVRAELTRG